MPTIMRDRRFILTFTALAACSLLSGCVERLITVKSNPSGAIVFLNDEEIGRTPATVPFRFYGVYDVRLELEPRWMPLAEAAVLFGVSEAEILKRIDNEQLDGRDATDGGTEVKVYYQPLWTKHEAKAPWWEAPGPDLVVEAIPNQSVHLEWDFKLDPIADMSSEAIVQRAREMQKQLPPTE